MARKTSAFLLDTNVISETTKVKPAHLDRLLGGLLLATSPRIDWAKLLHRTYAVDVLRCGRCGGRLRVLAAITEKATAKKILAHLGRPTEPIVARSRARDPAEFWPGTPSVVE